MNQELLEENNLLTAAIRDAYLDNMELELGKKYKNKQHEIHAGLSNPQYSKLQKEHKVSHNDMAEIYAEFLKMKPSKHLKQVMDAFHASGGNIDIEPEYNESAQRLRVNVKFIVKGVELNKIEGLSELEHYFVKMNAMIQVANVLSGTDADINPEF